MNEITPNNIEQKRPPTPEELEVIRKYLEGEEKQKNASELLNAMEKGPTKPGVPLDTGPSDKLVVEAEKVGIKTATPQVVEHKNSDKTQEYIDRLTNSKSPKEAVDVLNEVLAKTERGDLTPNEASEIYSQSNILQ